MIRKIADNIISPLGLTSEKNYQAVVSHNSALSFYEDAFGLPEPCFVSLLDRQVVSTAFNGLGGTSSYSFFEKLCILSISRALINAAIDSQRTDVVFVLSTTKGNIDSLAINLESEAGYIGVSAEKIAGFFGNPNKPIVTSNACISGVCAQIAAIRLLLAGEYKYAVVVGADVLSRFIISGFQSFKALSYENCKPYDKDRIGLNLGEAAGTMILERVDKVDSDDWIYVGSSIHNDANHISGPSRTGEGSFRVLVDILKSIRQEDIAFVNAHGTATVYNDEMESIAIHRAELEEIPVNGLKGFYGHTLGAAGVIEMILSMQAIDNKVILPTRGYETPGTTYHLNLSNSVRKTEKQGFIKILSGFGGSNAGIAYKKGGYND